MHWYEKLDRWIAETMPELEVERDVPMSRCTTFRIGGPARRMAFPATGEQVVLLLHQARSCGAGPLVMGRGSNLLAPDGGLDRLVIQTARNLTALTEDRAEETGEPRLHAASGLTLARLADAAQKRGLTGLEFAHGIPGTVGGGICMNAGAYGGEMRQVVESATVLDPENGVRTLSTAELDFGYRHSILTDHPDWVVLSAVFRLQPGDPAEIRATMDTLMDRRKASQPLELPSAGSTFKRPEGYYAGTLIDQCGLKGLRIGGARVSEKHAGFVVSDGTATATDVRAVITAVQRQVLAQTGVHLEPEVRIL